MALVIGITLGLLGGGGSILTVPVLVYLLKIDPITSTGYSLFIVGIAALFGALGYLRKKLIDPKMVAAFGASSLVSVYLARRVLVPALPDELFRVSGFIVTREIGVMVLFAILMLASSVSMIRGGVKEPQLQKNVVYNYPMLIIQGLVIGLLVGMVGAGGGFLIVPASVIFSKVPMKMAIGTSLSIIAVNSLIGFTGDLQMREMDWVFLLSFSAIAVAGIFIGTRLSSVVPGQKLKPVFGWFVLVMGVYILGKELVF